MFSFDRDNDTICAIATAPGSGGIAVLRVSGSEAVEIARKLCLFLPSSPESHRIYYGYLREFHFDGSGPKLDEVLVSYFEKGRSFTGESTIEISCHGGRFLSARVLEELMKAGARLAQPGEFTYRAFMNQRLDLIQAEAVLELINSENTAASKLALRQLEGGFSQEFREIQQELTLNLAHLEANIDFASEDIEISSHKEILSRLENVRVKMQKLLAQYDLGRKTREGLSVLLVGEPNVGKSSLLNSLAKEERAIVTEIPGTTRDLVEATMEIANLPVRLIDTAGFRETTDPVESIGIERMKSSLDSADFVVVLVDGLDSKAETLRLITDRVGIERLIVAFSKMDLVEDSSAAKFQKREWLKTHLSAEIFSVLESKDRIVFLSSKEGWGLKELEAHFKAEIEGMSENRSSGLMNLRHREGLARAQEFLDEGLRLLNHEESPDVIAFELQNSLMAVYEILGERFDDQVMDRVFKEFCLGK